MAVLDGLFSIEQAANFLGVSRTSVQRWIKTKDIPAIKIGGRYFMKPSDVEAFVKITFYIEEA